MDLNFLVAEFGEAEYNNYLFQKKLNDVHEGLGIQLFLYINQVAITELQCTNRSAFYLPFSKTLELELTPNAMMSDIRR